MDKSEPHQIRISREAWRRHENGRYFAIALVASRASTPEAQERIWEKLLKATEVRGL
jgi:hypothetical protein